MSTLQEVLSVLLGAESEAKQIVAESESEASAMLQTTREKFASERSGRIESAHGQAREIADKARDAAKNESERIANLCEEERDLMQKRFSENADTVIDSIVSEIAEGFASKKRGVR